MTSSFRNSANLDLWALRASHLSFILPCYHLMIYVMYMSLKWFYKHV